MKNDKFVYVTYIRTTPRKLWDAMTQPKFTRQYWHEVTPDSKWKAGDPWKLMLPDGRVGDSGTVVECKKPRRLVLKWRNEFIAEMRAEGYTRCTWQLEPMGKMVKLTVTHEIARTKSKFIKGVSAGWPMILSSLKSFLETGDALEATKKWPKNV
jgi:uncharacterized protein YndB with AHSA1/START domain